MESITKQLVNIGHGMSAEVAKDEPAVGKLLAELSSALDVQYERGNALKAKCAALAAENARCKIEISRCHQTVDEMFKNRGKWIDKEWLSSIWSTSKRLMEETPATDAFLAEMRAQGIEMAAKSDQFSMWVQQGLRSFAIGVRQGDECADELRKGVQS